MRGGDERNLRQSGRPKKRPTAHADAFPRTNAAQQIDESFANSIPIRSSSHHLMPNCLVTGGLKARDFSNLFIRKIAADQQDFALTTPSEYLTAIRTSRSSRRPLRAGATRVISKSGSIKVIHGFIRICTRRRVEWSKSRARTNAMRHPDADRVLKQLARELLLAQSSDWAFLMKTGTAREYATQRTTRSHLAASIDCTNNSSPAQWMRIF